MNRAGRNSGYATFLVAIVVALLAVVLLAVARVQEDASPKLKRLQSEVAQETTAQSIVARAAFLLLSEPIGPRSILIGGDRSADVTAGSASERMHAASGAQIAEAHLDGRRYAVNIPGALSAGWASVSLQDENGLINLNSLDDDALGALLLEAGVPERTAQHLAATLGDYVDEDDLVRPMGAEKNTYQRERLPVPANRALASRWGALNAIDWSSALNEAQLDGVWRSVSVGPAGNALNVNTAPPSVLSAVLGDPRTARELIERREKMVLANKDELEGLIGVNTRANGAVLATQTGNRFRLVVSFYEAGRSWPRELESQLELAGPDAERPVYWREAWRELAGTLDGQGRNVKPSLLPESAALFSN
ncbi:MAG: type II secretion system protein GspK [Hyphomonadaceae bacterium]